MLLHVIGSPQGVVPLRGGRRLSGAEPSVKNPLLHVSLYGKTPCYRAPRGIEVSCERVRVNRVVGWGDVVKPPTCVKRRCAKRADAEGGGEWRDGNHSMHMPPYHMLMWLAYIHVLCTVQTLPRSAASPICLALLESCRSAVLRSHHHPLAPPMCVYVRRGLSLFEGDAARRLLVPSRV